MKSRIDQVANPDVSTFNIAMPKKGRLAIFESICPEAQKEKKAPCNSKKSSAGTNGQKKQRNDVKQQMFQRKETTSMKLSNALGFC